MEVTLKAEHILAMANLCGEADIRPWVNGVWIEASPETLLWATTGFVLGVLDTEELASEVFTVRIPAPVLAGMKRFAGPVVVRSDDGKLWRAENFGTVQHWEHGGEVMPDLRRPMPRKTSGIAQSFDLELLQRFSKVRERLLPKKSRSSFSKVMIAQNGGPSPGAALVTIAGFPEFYGAVMPLDDNALDVANMRRGAPDWVTDKPADRTSETPADCADLV